ncbi:FAD-binding oxidoreductase [Chitinophaga filiformis]|uniref:NAD(P)/FAD-dependent oxidoreductase n=1 Tax=Chitinophaga filiformis TaxID=104663 RepID=UPI001F456578|nr:FAD-dependent oxidoreductase [Chitinophaga filiformis]MCF6402669.1 FAD-binding oxidoreductase [Chitinophaga filiformis]MCF6403413.1 FAD-binding oxidoreductase [Chitinophaga filiformis]
MDLHAGYPYSLVKYGLPFNYPRLDHDVKTDVLIAGGGISGALAAYYLTAAGIPAIVADSRTIGLGSTCASTSLIQYEIDVSLSRLTNRIGEKNAVAAYRLCYEAIGVLEKICKKIGAPFFDRRDSLFLASYKKDQEWIRKEYALRKLLGFDVSYWDDAMVKDKMGFDAPGAIYSRMAAQTDTYMLTHLLHQYNIKKGVEVYDRTTVADISHQRNGVIVHTQEGHRIKAKYLIMATGYEASQYIREPLLKLRSTYATASESLQMDGCCWHNNCLIWETKDPYLYMRPTKDNRILVGGRDEYYYNPSRRDKLISKKGKMLQEDFNKKFPHIRFISEFQWTGTFISTDDGLPLIGNYPAMPRTYFALGFGGNGITFAQIAAEIITAIILGKKNAVPQMFAFGRG